jgi:hypothetical protein
MPLERRLILLLSGHEKKLSDMPKAIVLVSDTYMSIA